MTVEAHAKNKINGDRKKMGQCNDTQNVWGIVVTKKVTEEKKRKKALTHHHRWDPSQVPKDKKVCYLSDFLVV
jgi:hypothetical protein